MTTLNVELSAFEVLCDSFQSLIASDSNVVQSQIEIFNFSAQILSFVYETYIVAVSHYFAFILKTAIEVIKDAGRSNTTDTTAPDTWTLGMYTSEKF